MGCGAKSIQSWATRVNEKLRIKNTKWKTKAMLAVFHFAFLTFRFAFYLMVTTTSLRLVAPLAVVMTTGTVPVTPLGTWTLS